MKRKIDGASEVQGTGKEVTKEQKGGIRHDNSDGINAAKNIS